MENAGNVDTNLYQNTFPFSNNVSSINSETVVSLPNIYASVEFSAPKGIEKTLGVKVINTYLPLLPPLLLPLLLLG